jgi:hypothetical protein
LGTADGQARPFLDLGLLHQLPPYCLLPSSLPLYRLDVAEDLAYSTDEEEEQMVLVQPYTFWSHHCNPYGSTSILIYIQSHKSKLLRCSGDVKHVHDLI